MGADVVEHLWAMTVTNGWGTQCTGALGQGAAWGCGGQYASVSLGSEVM